MIKKQFVFDKDSLEPATARKAFERTSLPAPWQASEHSTFDRPSRAMDIINARQQRQARNLGITALCIGVSVACIAAIALLR